MWWLYISLAPVYWLPYVPQRLLELFKAGLIGVGAVTAVVYGIGSSKVRYSRGFLGIVGFSVLLLSISPGLIQGIPDSSIKMFLNISYAFCTFLSFQVLVQSKKDVVELFSYASLVIGGLGMYSVFAGLGIAPDFVAPRKFNGTTVSISGFTGLRTGWSNGIALYVPFAAYLIVWHHRVLIKIAAALAILGIFLSQLTVAGRSGLLATIFGCVSMLCIFGKRYMIVAGLIVGGVLIVTYLPQLEGHLRLDRVEGGFDMKSVDHLSAGRIESYTYALDNIVSNPLTGVGFGYTDRSGHSVHNMLLRFTAETGLIFLFVFVGIAFSALTRCVKRRRISVYAMVGVVVVQGLMIAQFEPSALMGSFQNSALWWAVLGIIAGLAYTDQSDLKSIKS